MKWWSTRKRPGPVVIATLVLGLAVALLPALFAAIQWYGLKEVATRALTSGYVGFYHGGPVAPEVWSVPLEDSLRPSIEGDGHVGILTPRFLDHVRDGRGEWRPGSIYSYVRGDECFFFTVEGTGNPRDAGNPTSVLATDVSVTWVSARFSWYVVSAMCLLVEILLVTGARMVRQRERLADEARRDFFANASHELKSPLMAIGAHMEAVSAGHETFEAAEAVIDRELDRSERLVGDILALSKSEAGMIEAVEAPFDVREMVFDVVRALEPEAKSRGMVLEPVVPKAFVLRSDEDKVRSIVTNLVINALRHGRETVRLVVEVREAKVMVVVENDGVPVDEGTVSRMFDRYVTGDPNGTGIGLALAAQYAALLGATLKVSPSETGTRASLSFG